MAHGAFERQQVQLGLVAVPLYADEAHRPAAFGAWHAWQTFGSVRLARHDTYR